MMLFCSTKPCVSAFARFSFKLLAAAALSLILAACERGASSATGKPLVVATTTMAADLARVIGGDRVEVQGLMGADVDPHSYIPRISDSRLIEQADLIVYNGLHLEGRFQRTLEEMSSRGRNTIALAEMVDAEKLIGAVDDFPGTKDPHIWGDPRLWAETIRPLVEALSSIDPDGAELFRIRGEAYRKELESLDQWARETLAAIAPEHRVLVTSHDAFHYLGHAYELEVRGLQGVSTASEAGLRDRRDLVNYLRTTGIPAVFPESTLNQKGIATVAAEAGVRLSTDVLYSDALGKPGDAFTLDGDTHDRGTYLGMMRHNIHTIARNLRKNAYD
jgi:manganese/zinc/iron transport system substrate-binding protein